MKEIRFDDRVAIVTGAGGGLGLCCARQLAQRGASVVVNYLGVGVNGERGSPEVAQRAAEDIRQRDGNTIADWSDVADPEGATQLIELARSTFGRVDIVISNAGILRDSSFLKMPLAAFTEVVNVHLLGAVNVLRSAWPLMVEGNYGRIVLITSHAGLHGNFGQANYSAAKLALVGLLNSLRIEGARSNILINAVAPLAATRMSELSSLRSIKGELDPTGPAAAVLFLSSDALRDSGRISPRAGI